MATCGLLYGERAASLLSYSPIDRKIALCIAAGKLNAHSVLNVHTLYIGRHTLPRSQTTNPLNKKIRLHGIPYLQRYIRSCKITVDCIKGCISASQVGTYRLYISVF